MADNTPVQLPQAPSAPAKQAEPGKYTGMADWGYHVQEGVEDRQAMQEIGRQPMPSISEAGFPQLVPIVDFGAGGEKEKKSTVLDQILAQDAQFAQKLSTTPKTSYLRSEFVGDPQRFDYMRPGEDNQTLEDRAYNQQSTGERTIKSVANMVNGFTKTVVEGITAPLVGVGYMIGEGKGSAFYDNPYMKALDKWKGFEIYESSKRKNAAWYSPDYWMSANTLNSFLSTVGDLAGFAAIGFMAEGTLGAGLARIGTGLERTIGGGAEFERGLQAIAESRAKMPLPKIGESLMGPEYNKAIIESADIAAGLPEGELGQEAVKELMSGMDRITQSGMEATEKKAAQDKLIYEISSKYIKKADNPFVKNFDKFHRATVGLVTNLGMAQSSAYQTSTNFREKMVNQILSQGRTPTKEELDRIDNLAARAGGVTGALMTIMGAVTLHGSWNALLAKKEGEQFVRNGIKDLIEDEPAVIDEFGKVSQVRTAEESVLRKGKTEPSISQEAKEKLSEIEKREQEELSKTKVADGTAATYTESEEAKVIKAKYDKERDLVDQTPIEQQEVQPKKGVSSTLKSVPKFLWKNISFAPGFGFLEFGLAPTSVESYYEKKFDTKNDDFFKDLSMIGDALGSNVKGIFTAEGIKDMILGITTGTLMHQVGGGAKAEREREASINTLTNRAIDAYNNTYLRSVTRAMVNSAKRGTSLRREYLQAIREGNKEAELTLRSQQMENYIFPRIKYGLKTFLDNDIKNERKLASTDQGIKDLQSLGILPAEGNIADLRRGYLEHLDSVQEYADRAETYYKALTLKYGGQLNPDGTKRYDDEHIEKLMFLSSGIDDTNFRMQLLTEEIRTSEIGTDPQLMKRYTGLIRQYEGMDAEEQRKNIGKLSTKETEKLFSDINKLSINPDKRSDLAKKLGDFLKLSIRKKQYINEYEKLVKQPELYSDAVKDTVVPGVGTTAKDSDTIPGNYIKEVTTKNAGGKIDLKIGETYYAGSRIVPGKTEDGKTERFRAFSKFTVVGEKITGEGEDRKRFITIRTEDGEQDIAEEKFANYKLGSETSLNKPENATAKFYFDNINNKFTYNLGKKKGGEIEGRLEFDSDKDQLLFVPDDTKRKPIEIEREDFSPRPILDKKTGKPVRSGWYYDEEGKPKEGELLYHKEPIVKQVGEITKASKEWIEAKATEKERIRREERLLNRMIAVDEILQNKKALHERAKEDLEHNKLKLEDAQEKLKKAQEEVDKYPARENRGNLTKATKKFLKTQMGVIRDLTRIVNNTEDNIKNIQKRVDDLEQEIDYLSNYNYQESLDPLRLMNAIDDSRTEALIAIEDSTKKIGQLSSFVDKVRDVIKSTMDTFMSYVDDFKSKYPDIPFDISKLDQFRNTLTEKIDQAREMLGEEGAAPYISDMQDILKKIDELEELEIPAKRRDLDNALQEIDKLHSDIEELGKQYNIDSEIYDGFKKVWDDYIKEEKRRLLFDSPVYKAKFAALQGKIQSGENAEGIVGTPQETQKAANEEWSSSKKSVWTVFHSTVNPSHKQRPANGWPKGSFPAQFNNWSDRVNRFIRNGNLGFPIPKDANPKDYVPKDGKLLVMFVTRNNQSKFFDKEFLPETYTSGTDTVNNATDNKRASIALFHVYHDAENGKFHYVDENGKILNEVGNKTQSTDEAVFSFMETAEPERNQVTAEGKDKHRYDATAEEIAMLLKEAEEMRGKILSYDGEPNYYEYSESRGIVNDREGEVYKTSIEKAKLGANTDLRGKIEIPTIGLEGKRVGSVKVGDNLINFPLGYPLFVNNNNVAFLNGIRFGEVPGQVDHLYKVIAAMVDNYYQRADGEVDSIYTNYLSSVLFFSSKTDKKTGIANNQLYLSQDKNMGKVLAFRIGSEKKVTMIPFIPEEVERSKDIIKEWLSGAFHSVSSNALNLSKKGETWSEIPVGFTVDKEGKPSLKKWNSYEEYLLSDQDGKRENIPLTVNMKEPAEFEGPLVNKYFVPDFKDDFFSLKKPAKQPAPEKEPTEGGVEKGAQFGPEETGKKTEETKQPGAPVGQKEPTKKEGVVYDFKTPNTYTDDQGNTYTFIAEISKGKLIVAVRELKDKSGNVLDISEYGDPLNETIRRSKIIKSVLEAEDKPGTKEEVKGAEIITTPPANLAPEPMPEPPPFDVDVAGAVVADVVTQDYGVSASELADMYDAQADSSRVGGSLMAVTGETELYEPGNREEERLAIEATTPQFSYEEVPHIIKDGSGTYAFGRFLNNYIEVAKEAPQGAGFHEQWHGVEDSFLSPSDLKDIKEEFFSREGTYQDRFGRTISYGTPKDIEVKTEKGGRRFFEKDGKRVYIANEYDRREKMAEDFRLFRNKDPRFSSPSKATNFFRRLWNFVQKLFGKKVTQEELFNRVKSGYYKNFKLPVRTSDQPVLMEIAGMTEVEKKATIHGIAWKMIDNLRRSSGGLVKVGEGTILSDMFQPVYEWMKDKYTNPLAQDNIHNIRLAEIEKILTPEQIKARKDNNATKTADIIRVTKADDRQKDLIMQADQRRIGTLTTWLKLTNEDNTAFKPEVVRGMKEFFRKYKIVFDEKMSNKKAKEAIEAALAEDMLDQQDKHHKEDSDTKDYHVEDVKDRGYDVEYMRIDAIGGAPIEVKLLFAFSPQPKEGSKNPNINKYFGQPLDTANIQFDLTHLQLPTLINARKMMVKVLNGLAGITDKKAMQRRMFEMAAAEPGLVRIYDAVYGKPASQLTRDEYRLRISFTKWASKMKPAYVSVKLDEDGRTYIIDSNIDTDTKLIRAEWFSNIRNSPHLTRVDDVNSGYQLNKKAIKPVDTTNNASVIDFLRSVHLPVTNEIFSKLNKSEGADLRKAAGDVYSMLKADMFITKASFDMEGPLNRLTSLIAKAEHLRMPTSHRNVEGNAVMNHVMYNGLNRLVQSVIQAGTIDKLRDLQPRLFADTWSKNNYWIQKGGPLFKEDGTIREEVKEGQSFVMTVTEGLINDNTDNTSNKTLNRGSRMMTTLNMLLGQKGMGIFYNFIPADSGNESGLRVPHFITKDEYKSGSYKKKVEDRAIQYLSEEIELIKENTNNQRIVTKESKKNGTSLQVFKKILSRELGKDGKSTPLLDVVTDYARDPKDVTTEDFMKSILPGTTRTIEQRVKDAFWKDREARMNSLFDFLVDRRLLSVAGENKDGKIYKWFNINNDFTERMEYGTDTFTEKNVKNILEYANLNLFFHNNELARMFYGPWYEMSDPTKRHKLYQSGTESTYSGDPEFNTWYNNTQNTIGGVVLNDGEFSKVSSSDELKCFIFNHDKGIYSAYHSTIEKKLIEKYGEEKGKKLAEPYKSIEDMDGGGILTDFAWKQYVIRSSDPWTDEDEAQEQYNRAIAILADANGRNGRTEKKTLRPELRKACEEIRDKGNPQTWATGQPKKPLAVGMLKLEDQNIPFSLKNSVMRMGYDVVEGTGMEDLYWWAHDNKIGYLGPESTEKVGKFPDSPELYKIEKGKGIFNLSSLDESRINKHAQSIGWEDINKIVETAKDKTGKTIGSQAQSIAIANAMSHGLPTDFYDIDTDDYDTKLAEWEALGTEEKKREASEKYALVQDNNRAISEISNRGVDRTLFNLGINKVKTEGGYEYEFSDKQKVIDFLKNEITKRDLPDNLAEALDWEYDSFTGQEKLKYDIEAMPNYEQLSNIIWSHVQKNVVSPKLNGTDNILNSSTLWERKGFRKIINKDGKEFISSSELKFYTPDQVDPVTGKKGTSLMEVYAPNHFRKALEKWAAKTGRKLPSNAELMKHLMTEDGELTKEGYKLLAAVGFRVPTQGMNSLDAVRIVPFKKVLKENGKIDFEKSELFTPNAMGDTMIVPSELVAKAGIDFDIDKMGTYNYNFTIDENGLPRYIEFVEDISSEEGLKRIWEQRKEEQRERDLPEQEEKIDKLVKQGVISEKNREEILETALDAKGESFERFKKRIKEQGIKDPWELNSERALQNKYFETMERLITHPDNYEQLVTPNNSDEMIAIEKKINKALNLIDESKGFDYSNLSDIMYLVNERQDYLDLKGPVVGMSAIGNTGHIQVQGTYVEVGDNGTASEYERKSLGDFKIYLPHAQLKRGDRMVTTYSGSKNRIGNYISDFISQLINGAVDGVKNKWLIRLMKNKDVLSTSIFLGRCGVDPEYVFTFMNQPSIQEYIKQLEINKTLKGIDPDVAEKRDDIIARTLSATYKDQGEEEMTARRSDLAPGEEMFTLKELYNGLELTGRGVKMSEMNEAEREFQRQVLFEYLKYTTLATSGSLREQMGNNVNNMKNTSRNNIVLKQERNRVAKEQGLLGTTVAMFKDGKNLQSVILNNLIEVKRAIDKMLPLGAAEVVEKMSRVFTDFNKFLPDDKRAKIMNNILSTYINFAIETVGERNFKPLNRSIKELMVDPKTNTARLLGEIRRNPNIKGDLKALLTEGLGSIGVKLTSNPEAVKNVTTIMKPDNALESDSITDAFRELRDNPNTAELYKKILYTALLQSGVKDTRESYAKMIPNEDWIKYVQPVLDIMKDPKSPVAMNFEKTMSFYRNNYRDSDIVPKIQGYFNYETFSTEYNFYYDSKIEGYLKKVLAQPAYKGYEIPGILKVSAASANSRYPVVKIVDQVTKPDGTAYTKAEKNEMAKKKDYSFVRTRLFQQVMDESGESPFVITYDKRGNPVYAYKEINPWGDGNALQEHYEEPRPSVLNRGYAALELTDKWVREATNPEGQSAINQVNLPKSNIEYLGSDSPDVPKATRPQVNLPAAGTAINSTLPDYKGGYSTAGKGTPQGDGKDAAMRQVSDGFIGEVKYTTVDDSMKSLRTKGIGETSTETSWNTISDNSQKNKVLRGNPQNNKQGVAVNVNEAKVIMLARNAESGNKPLNSTTKYDINAAHSRGASFVVGDMPGVDSKFVEYLNEIGAKYTIFHTGSESRIKRISVNSEKTEADKLKDEVKQKGKTC